MSLGLYRTIRINPRLATPDSERIRLLHQYAHQIIQRLFDTHAITEDQAHDAMRQLDLIARHHRYDLDETISILSALIKAPSPLRLYTPSCRFLEKHFEDFDPKDPPAGTFPLNAT